MSDSLPPVQAGSWARWETAVVSGAVVCALALGFAHLGRPALWHDELVHFYVAKSILAHGFPTLPSGHTYVSGVSYSGILAAFLAVFGDSEFAARTPSVLLFGINVLVVYLLFRRLLGRPTAAVAAITLALSPWSVAWAREARFYTMQQLLYLLAIWAAWKLTEAARPKARFALAGACLALYLLAIFTSLESILFVAPLGAYAILRAVQSKQQRPRFLVLAAMAALIGAATLLAYRTSLPKPDRDAIFREGGLGGKLANPHLDRDRSRRYYYFDWLGNNLSVGYFALAMVGFVAMTLGEGRRGLYTAIAFWAPLLVLTYLIGYRRARFMFFAYPFYVVAHSYAAVYLTRFVLTARRSWLRIALACCVVVFGVRLAWSSVKLIGNSLHTASGADDTLAVLHPDWRKPCLYVRNHLDHAVVIATSYLPPRYYIGHVDNWYPSRIIVWEAWESGLPGLKTLNDLKKFVHEHPKGYFLAQIQRFGRWKQFARDKAWVKSHMKRLDQASGRDVILYSWGM